MMRIDDATVFKIGWRVYDKTDWAPIRAEIHERMYWEYVEDGTIETAHDSEMAAFERDVDIELDLEMRRRALAAMRAEEASKPITIEDF